MSKPIFAAIACTLIAAADPAFAAEYTPELDSALQACLDAAVQQHPGYVTQWEVDSRTGGPSFRVDLVASDDLVWALKCEGGKIVSDERKMGNKNYKMLSARGKIPEATCRQAAVEEYPGAELTRMQSALNWKGNPYFTYTFLTPDAREATVEVNAVTGKIDRTHSSRVD
jgi:uncharacterized membrane protein YkoI